MNTPTSNTHSQYHAQFKDEPMNIELKSTPANASFPQQSSTDSINKRGSPMIDAHINARISQTER
jgi:hypothetical protein